MSKPGSTPFGEPMEKKFIGSSEKRKSRETTFPCSRDFLGGGFEYFLFSPLLGGLIQLDQYFSIGLKPPTSFRR